MVVLGWCAVGHGQMQPTPLRVPGEASFGRLGSATITDAIRMPSVAPIGVTQIGQPATANTGRTPGSNLGLIDGTLNSHALGSALGSALGGQVQGVYSGGSSLGYSAPSFMGSTSFAPGGVGTPTTGTPGFNLMGTGFTPMAGGAAAPAFNNPGAPLTPTMDPRMGARAPATQADLPAPKRVSRDELVNRAMDRFSRAEYRECLAVVKPVAQASQASLEIRQVYIAALVANGNVASAAFEAVQAAKAYPRGLFTDHTFVDLYKDNPDLPKHFEQVEEVGRTALTLEPGILWAMYQRVRPGSGNDPELTLKVLSPKPADAEWFNTLRRNVEKVETK